MKKFLKIVLSLVLVVVLLCFGTWHFYLKHKSINTDKTAMPDMNIEAEEVKEKDKVSEQTDEPDDLDYIQVDKRALPSSYEMNAERLKSLYEKSDRLNIVLFSHDGARADTIMFVSFDPNTKSLDIINIPRDTYWPVEGYTSDIGNQKINAVYGRGNNLGGSKGVKNAIANLLQVPVHYYAKLNYSNAESIINSFGGVEIYVDRDMVYDDIYADPPLHIDISKGYQHLDGHESVDFLRWRKNNGELGAGDLPRIDRMQDFAAAAIDEIVSLRLPKFVNACFHNIYTDIELDLALSYAIKAQDLESSNISFHRLPGKVEGYFYVKDKETTQELLLDLYGDEPM